MDLRNESLAFRKQLRKLGINQLKDSYDELCLYLDAEYNLEINRTSYEKSFYKELQHFTKLQIFRSFWIGKRNYDFFIPAVRSPTIGERRSFKGLVIEIDGDIHNNYFKMKKDQSKFVATYDLGIGCVIVENGDFKIPVVKAMLERLRTLKRSDSRAKSRVMRNIYLYTLVAHKKLILKNKLKQSLKTLKRLEIL